MPRLEELAVQPLRQGESRGMAEYLRRLGAQLGRNFFRTRETCNALADFEHLEFSVWAPAGVKYGWHIPSANRRIKAIRYGCRSGSCNIVVSHGPTGSEVDVDWEGVTPSNTIGVTTTIGREICESADEVLEAGTWLLVEVSALAGGCNGLALTLELT